MTPQVDARAGCWDACDQSGCGSAFRRPHFVHFSLGKVPKRCRLACSMWREIGEREACLMEAQPREAPYPDAIDPVPSLVGQVRQEVRVNAFWKTPHGAGIALPAF